MAAHYRFIVERSEYMRNRHDSYKRDLQDTVRKLSVKGSILPEYGGWFAMISYVDKGTSAPTWLAAYQGRDVAVFGWGLLDKDVHSYGFRITPAESYFEGMAKGAGSLVDMAGGEGDKTDAKNIWLAQATRWACLAIKSGARSKGSMLGWPAVLGRARCCLGRPGTE